MSTQVMAMVLSLTAVFLTTITAFFSVLSYAKVIGMEKSTHKIEWQEIAVPEGQKSLSEQLDEELENEPLPM